MAGELKAWRYVTPLEKGDDLRMVVKPLDDDRICPRCQFAALKLKGFRHHFSDSHKSEKASAALDRITSDTEPNGDPCLKFKEEGVQKSGGYSAGHRPLFAKQRTEKCGSKDLLRIDTAMSNLATNLNITSLHHR